jgi:hypothetical protein
MLALCFWILCAVIYSFRLGGRSLPYVNSTVINKFTVSREEESTFWTRNLRLEAMERSKPRSL